MSTSAQVQFSDVTLGYDRHPAVHHLSGEIASGALLAVIVGRLAGWWHPGDAPGFILSLLGAIMLLALYRVLKTKTAA